MRITAKVTERNDIHSRLSVWVNGALISNPGGICLRNEEVVEFLDLMGGIGSFHIKAKLRSMIAAHWEKAGSQSLSGITRSEKRLELQVILDWIEERGGQEDDQKP